MRDNRDRPSLPWQPSEAVTHGGGSATHDYQALLTAVLSELDPGHVGPTPDADKLADEMGELMELIWTGRVTGVDRNYWGSHDATMRGMAALWGNRRHAPLTDATCAFSIPWPERYRKVLSFVRDDKGTPYVTYERWNPGNGLMWLPAIGLNHERLDFIVTDPRALPAALCVANLAAWEHSKGVAK